jgi:hypothetical protein
MRFLLLVRTEEIGEAGVAREDKQVARANALIHEMVGADVLIAADGLLPSSAGARVRLAEGRHEVAEGPFRDEKDLVRAFALIEVSSKDEATEWAGKFAVAHANAEIEVRQIADISDFGPLARGLRPEVWREQQTQQQQPDQYPPE